MQLRGHLPGVLHTLAAVYEVDYIDLMRRAAYIPDDAQVRGAPTANVAFRGASQLSEEQRQTRPAHYRLRVE